MKKVAFICVHNSCRSQIAEALGKKLASDVFESYSAGTETKPKINQDAVRLMKHVHGIDMEETQYPQYQRKKVFRKNPCTRCLISAIIEKTSHLDRSFPGARPFLFVQLF